MLPKISVINPQRKAILDILVIISLFQWVLFDVNGGNFFVGTLWPLLISMQTFVHKCETLH